ncbi:hypothetical protein ES705_27921 [subsurface metagenome]
MNRLKNHHSLADFDWSDVNKRALDTGLFVSPPSCLRCRNDQAGFETVHFLCKHADTLDIPDGRIVCWMRTHHPNSAGFRLTFRNQCADGSADFANCYFIGIFTDTTYIGHRIAGDETYFRTITWAWAPDTWYHIRLTWESEPDPGNGTRIKITFELEVDDEWVQQGDTAYDSADLWKDSGTNRVGGSRETHISYPNYEDDTEYWAKS